MDPEIINDIASSVASWRMYPFFDICHYILMSAAIRDDIPQSGSVAFSRKHPFACWFATMLMCFGGGILVNFILAEPLLTCFDDHRSVLLATAVWYLINYSPFDIVYKIYSIFSIRLLICALKEVQRAKKISLGVSHAFHEYPHSVVTCILVGLLKGTGSSFMRTIASLTVGYWRPSSIEFLACSYTTKISLLSAIVFYCDLLDLIPLSRDQLFLAVVGVLVYMRVAMLCLGLKDPFAPIQNLTCSVFFGGVVDALREAVTRRQKSDDVSDASGGSGQTSGSPISGMGVVQDGYGSSAGMAASAGGGAGGAAKDGPAGSTLRRANQSSSSLNSEKKRD